MVIETRWSAARPREQAFVSMQWQSRSMVWRYGLTVNGVEAPHLPEIPVVCLIEVYKSINTYVCMLYVC